NKTPILGSSASWHHTPLLLSSPPHTPSSAPGTISLMFGSELLLDPDLVSAVTTPILVRWFPILLQLFLMSPIMSGFLVLALRSDRWALSSAPLFDVAGRASSSPLLSGLAL
ncbi:MAG: hypothetical protein ACFFAE_10815, partial [Candidatus Hodarchaeota archaeon]